MRQAGDGGERFWRQAYGMRQIGLRQADCERCERFGGQAYGMRQSNLRQAGEGCSQRSEGVGLEGGLGPGQR